jgi:CheY-like chemotaxis protein
MPPAILERIFDPFFTTQAPGEGTGLGLSVVHGIVKDHEGAVSVYSEPGKGTIFHLYFPAVMQGAAHAAKTPQSVPLGRGQRLLYVDDEEALVLMITRSLNRLGYNVRGEVDPLRALEIFRRNPEQFDVVVTDLSMPGMSGAELARRVLEICPEMPVVMMSGYIRVEDEEQARQLGVHDLILKPDTIESLAQTLDRLFTSAPAERQSPERHAF